MGQQVVADTFDRVSKQEEIGIVIFFHVRRGFGRVRTDSRPDGVFVHFSEVQGEAQILIPNELVKLEVEESEKGAVGRKISRLTRRLPGTVRHMKSGKGIIQADNGQEYTFEAKDILSDTRSFNRVIAGWRVQFSPLEECNGLEAREIVICDTRSPLFQVATMDNWTSILSTLADIAEPEAWDDPLEDKPLTILENYLLETFRILYREGGTYRMIRHRKPDLLIWNTGLLTPNGEEILARMDHLTTPPGKNGYLTSPGWRLVGFFPESDRRIPDLTQKPPLALHFVPYGRLLPDPTLSLLPDLDHLMKRNHRLPGFWTLLPKEEKLQRLRGVFHRLELMLRRNPRLAVPQWYEESIQYLLPLDLGDGRGPIGAFVLNDLDGKLRVQTILQLEWAYQNARLLGPLQHTWLSEWKEKVARKKNMYDERYHSQS